MSSENQRRRRLTLRTYVPRAGFIWPGRPSVLGLERQDRAILNALRDRGGATFLEAGSRGAPREAPRQVQHILAGMFDTAEADAQAGRIGQYQRPLDWVGSLGGRLRWAQHLEEDLFVELFFRVYDARRAWHGNPREPFNTEEHGVLAHAIDDFHRAASDGWAVIDDTLFYMAQPPRVEGGAGREGDDPAAAAPHTQGTGAIAAVGEAPHPQTPSASGGAVEMDEDGGTEEDEYEEDRGREVRQHLAGTSLGEEMEVDE